MSFHTHIPCAELQPFVHMFWAWDGYAPSHSREHILPHMDLELTFNLAGPLCFYYPEEGYRPRRISAPVVSGPRSTFYHVSTSATQSLLAIWFKAGAARVFFGVSASDLLNQHIPLHLLWGQAGFDLHDQVLAATTTHDRFQHIEHALLHRLDLDAEPTPAIRFAQQTLHQTAPPIREVLAQVGMSAPRFIQHFRDAIGLPPKRFARIQRFHHALRLMAHQQHHGWTDVAVRCGYFDQAHFINDFRTFAGITPSQYHPQSPNHHLNLAVV